MKVSEAAKIFGKDPSWVRAGIVTGWLPIGVATRNGKQVTSVSEIDGRRGRINYYISDDLVWNFVGRKGEKEW